MPPRSENFCAVEPSLKLRVRDGIAFPTKRFVAENQNLPSLFWFPALAGNQSGLLNETRSAVFQSQYVHLCSMSTVTF